MPAMHCFSPGTQHFKPVHKPPPLLQSSAHPAAHVECFDTQHLLPVHIMPGPEHAPASPLTHWAGPLAQHWLPVQKALLPWLRHASASPFRQVHTWGTLHMPLLDDQDTPAWL